MPAQDAGLMEPQAGGHGEPFIGPAEERVHEREPSTCGDPRIAALSVFSVLAARSTDTQERPDSAAQASEAGGGDMEQRDEAPVPQELRMPWLRKGPTGEGYCRHCHFIVGTFRRKLITHAGYWKLWQGGAVHKGPDVQHLSTKHVEWCEGSGHLPSPMPANPLDPWSWDRKS